MTNREQILKLIAGLDDVVLCDIYENLPQDVLNSAPIVSACETCPRRTEGCYGDMTDCNKHVAAWMNMEVQPK